MIADNSLRERYNEVETARRVDVGIGEVFSGGGDLVLAARGVGSCVCVCLWSPEKKAGGMAHVLLPAAPAECSGADSLKYADRAIPELVGRLERAGAGRGGLKAVLAGGARVIEVADPARPGIGERNVQAAVEILRAHGIEPELRDIGGTNGRNIIFHPGQGWLDSVDCLNRAK